MQSGLAMVSVNHTLVESLSSLDLVRHVLQKVRKDVGSNLAEIHFLLQLFYFPIRLLSYLLRDSLARPTLLIGMHQLSSTLGVALQQTEQIGYHGASNLLDALPYP